MSVRATTWAWEQDVDGTALLLLLAIADRADDDGVIWQSQKTLAAKTRTSERTVRRTLAALEERGLLERLRRNRKNGSRTSDYIVLNLPEDLAGGTPEMSDLAANLAARTNDNEPTGQIGSDLPATDDRMDTASDRAYRPPVSAPETYIGNIENSRSDMDPIFAYNGISKSEDVGPTSKSRSKLKEGSAAKPKRFTIAKGDKGPFGTYVRQQRSQREEEPSEPLTDEQRERIAVYDAKVRQLQHRYANLLADYDIGEDSGRQSARADWLPDIYKLAFEYPILLIQTGKLSELFQHCLADAISEGDQPTQLWLELEGARSPAYFLYWLRDNPQLLADPVKPSPPLVDRPTIDSPLVDGRAPIARAIEHYGLAIPA